MNRIRKICFILMIMSSVFFIKAYGCVLDSQKDTSAIVVSSQKDSSDLGNSFTSDYFATLNKIQFYTDYARFFSQQKLKAYRSLSKKNSKVKRKSHKLGKANFKSLASYQDNRVADHIEFSIPSRLIYNLEGYQKIIDSFTMIEITPD